MGYASIVFGALALLLLAAMLGVGIGLLVYISIALAIIGIILGVMSWATKPGKAGLILSLASPVIVFVVFHLLSPGKMVIQTSSSVGTLQAK